MALTNAEKQKRWRDRRNEQALALTGTPQEIANRILGTLGAKQAGKVVRALDKRLRAIKPDCKFCGGTGFAAAQGFSCDGEPATNGIRLPCPCDPLMPDAGAVQQAIKRRA
jgi:hypothetical protein